ncbi:MAG: T9SS type A sorting domain-containing protein [bacterium]
MEVSAVGIKFNANGTLAWGRTLSSSQAPYTAYPRAAVDIEGNLWIGFTETPVDSFCIDSLPSGWGSYGGSGVMGHAVIYKLDPQSGVPTLVDRIAGEARQNIGVLSINADNEGFVNVGVQTIDFCCNSLCQNCRDSCFTSPNGGSDYFRSETNLRRYTTAGGLVGSTWLASSDNDIYSSRIFNGRNGELLIFKHEYRSPQPYWTHVDRFGHWATSFSGETQLSASYAPTTDYSGNVLLWHWLVSTKAASDDDERETMVLDAATGFVKWTKPGIAGYTGADRDGNIYVNDFTAIHKFDQYGAAQWVCTTGVNLGSILHADTAGWFYFQYYTTLARYNGTKYLTICDAHRDSIPNVTFDLIKVTNNRPYFDEDTLGSFTTDSEGRLSLTPIGSDSFFVQLDLTGDTLVVGDSLKIAKHVHSVPAVKHQALLGTMYSAHLDNMQFAEDGHVFFDTLTSRNQDIVLNHTELRYNLLVSVEWEATEYYLRDLEDNITRMSNYLYDVTDGQARLDTVMIYDAKDQWDEADMRICADNTIRPYCDKGVAGILRSATDGYQIYMPRIWWYNGDGTRNHTGGIYPLDLTTESVDYRTKAHEFGHYALGFYDEYRLYDPATYSYVEDDATLRCLPTSIFHYGFMDTHYESGGVMSSEMSNAFRYDLASCRNTEQWGMLNSSCWDHFENWVEAVTWGADNLFVPILKPDASDSTEHLVTNPAVYFPGPNNNMANLDHDVGIMVYFPNTPSAQMAGYSNKHVTVHHSTGGDNAKIQLWNNPQAGPPSEIVINQGNSSDAAGAWVVGVKDASNQILAYKGNSQGTVTKSAFISSPQEVTTGWLYGLSESGGTGVSKVGNLYTFSSAEDSITIELNEVQGYYPLICSVTLQDISMNYDLTVIQPFLSDPTLYVLPSYGGTYNHTFTATVNGYEAGVTDSLGNSGSLMLWAIDDSSSSFFVLTDYTMSDISHDQPLIWLFGGSGQSEFKLDSANISLTKAMILSSPYPIIRTGLDQEAVQAGEAHCLSVFPDDPMIGSNQIVIRYDDVDLKLGDILIGDEASLAVYHWVDAATGWELIGGSVDTASNAIYAPITQPGVYAAFTFNIITDVEDDEHSEVLPYRFELSQNYPNPFNPVTTIEYSLPERSHVIIDIYNVLGQIVRTLINETKSAGSYRTEWNGSDDAGRVVSTGVYVYRFSAGDVVQTKKMVLMK